jgi:glucan phosphoethanolaminetransferase (alkaline phosphatase superfamily)
MPEITPILTIIEHASKKLIEISPIILISALLFAKSAYRLDQKKAIQAALIFTLATIPLLVYEGMLAWFSGIESASFIELFDFNKQDAYFYFSTLADMLPFMLPPNKTIILSFAASITMGFAITKIARNRHIPEIAFTLALLAAHAPIASGAYARYKMGQTLRLKLNDQFSEAPSGFASTEDIDLFIYIGESTSSMNMGIYGYPINTTPNLSTISQHDAGLLVFTDIRSTHTHTTPSLLRALSMPVTGSNREKFYGLSSILNSAGKTPNLFSVQPTSGSFSTHSHYIFKDSIEKTARNNQIQGNYVKPTTNDHDLLTSALKKEGVTIFHSIAGHGEYRYYITRDFLDKTPENKITLKGLVGKKISDNPYSRIATDLHDYDSAIEYIDSNIKTAIIEISRRSKPAAFIYFSDHGESVFTGRGHDSSRFVDEMSTVPLIIYFNKAYQEKYPHIYSHYKNAVRMGHVRLLDQLTPTILEILQIRSKVRSEIPSFAEVRTHPYPYILDDMSGTSKGVNIMNFQPDRTENSSSSMATMTATHIKALNSMNDGANNICYHRSNSLATALRAAKSTNCIETDLVVDGDRLNIYHPPEHSTGLTLNHVLNIAKAHGSSVWIDAKNIDNPEHCMKLQSMLTSESPDPSKLMVEFPSETNVDSQKIRACAISMRAAGIRTSYYVPTESGRKCIKARSVSSTYCIEVNSLVAKAISSRLFSDISFDHDLYPLIKSIPASKRATWNTWNVSVGDYGKLNKLEFKNIIIATDDDPNRY